MSHTHSESNDYWTRHHEQHVVLDIGDDVGALVLYTPHAYHGREIEVSPVGRYDMRVHSAVLSRSAPTGQTMFVAVYPELAAGTYRIWADDPAMKTEVIIEPGRVAEVNWR